MKTVLKPIPTRALNAMMVPMLYKLFLVAWLAVTSLKASSIDDCFPELRATILNDDLESIKQLLNVSAKKSLIDEQEWKIACIAAEVGNLNITKFIAAKNISILQRKNENGYTIGHIAAEHGHLDVVQYWDSYGRRGSKNDQLESVCCVAAEKGHLNVVKYCALWISEYETNPRKKIAKIALNNGHLEIALYLVKRSFYKYEFVDIIEAVIQKSSHERDNKTFESIAELANYRWISRNHYYDHCPISIIISLASNAKNSKLIHYLAEKNCTYLKTDMEIAFQQNLTNQKFLECLRENGALQLNDDDFKDTICHIAAKYDRLDVIQFVGLANENISILERKNRDGQTIFNIAAEKGYADIIQYGIREKPLCIVKKDWIEEPSYYWQYDSKEIRSTSLFHLAIKKNFMDLDTLIYLVEKKAVPLTITDPKDKETVGHTAANDGKMKILQYIITKEPSILSMADSYGNTILHILVSEHKLSVTRLRFYVSKGAPLTAKNNDHDTVAHILAENGNTAHVKCLVELEPSILTIGNKNGDTVIHILAKKNALSLKSSSFFVDKGAPLTAKNNDHDTVAHILAENGNTAHVEYLVEQEPSILTIGNKNGDTVVHILAKKNALSLKSFSFFVDKGAPLIMNNKNADNIALIAARMGNLPILEYIVRKESSFFANMSIRLEVSEAAANYGHSNILKFLAEKIPSFLARRLNILFKLANETEVLETLKHLKIICETKVRTWNSERFAREVLLRVIEHDYVNVLKYMKYDVNTVGEDGEPLMFTAFRRKRPNIFHYLATDGKIDLTAVNSEGNNILFIAAQHRDLEKIKYILDTLKAPINIEWRNNMGDTLLHIAVNEALTQAHRARQNNSQKVTKKPKTVNYYPEYGYQEESQDSQSQEESAYQPHCDDISVIKYLVEQKNADVNALGQANETVLHRATSCTNYHISNYLLNHGANPTLRDSNGHNFWKIIKFPTPEKASVQEA